MRLNYILITPARDEEAFIEQTIQSVISQTILPVRWVVVSDGSTDRTDAIVKEYCQRCQWIEFYRMPEHDDRQFAAKVWAFNAGLRRVAGVPYDVIGNLDADLSFPADLFEFLVGKFEELPDLGVCGPPFVEKKMQYDYRFTNIEHVSGACQLFRRKCFEEIGGYVPIKGGGIDWTAVTTARMKGWKTRTFTEKVVFHHRKMGSGNNTKWAPWFSYGKKDYFLGSHPLWQIFRSFYQMTHPPYILGGLSLLAGYGWASIRRMERPIPEELVHFIRMEQMDRLRLFWSSHLGKLRG
jgi:glycosyltransferase involved in cell wall biosynthesis